MRFNIEETKLGCSGNSGFQGINQAGCLEVSYNVQILGPSECLYFAINSIFFECITVIICFYCFLCVSIHMVIKPLTLLECSNNSNDNDNNILIILNQKKDFLLFEIKTLFFSPFRRTALLKVLPLKGHPSGSRDIHSEFHPEKQ